MYEVSVSVTTSPFLLTSLTYTLINQYVFRGPGSAIPGFNFSPSWLHTHTLVNFEPTAIGFEVTVSPFPLA